MLLTLLDDALYARLVVDPDTARLFSDEAEIEAMLQVESALAKVQGILGIVPREAAAAISDAAQDAPVQPADLAVRVAIDGVPVPALIAALRESLQPEYGQWLHWGATSQDIMDTGLSLRLGEALDLWSKRLCSLLARLAYLAETHAELPMAARTYGQLAVPTSFGAVVASWGRPLLRHRTRLAQARAELRVSLSGAAGTLSAMGPQGPKVRALLAAELGLSDPGASWHAERDEVGALAVALAGLLGSLGKMGEDLLLLTQSGIGEVRIEGGGGSSTMPQKENPVSASVLVALARTGIGLAGIVQGAALHRQQRDGAAWFTEWLTLPQLCCLTGRALALAAEIAERLAPDAEAMGRNMEVEGGVIHAEALSFALMRLIPRAEAQAVVKRLAREATDSSLPDLVRREFPDVIWLGPDLGQGPTDARAFGAVARASPTV